MAAPDDVNREDYETQVRLFNDFLHTNREEWEKKISDALQRGEHRIPVQLRDLKKASPGLEQQVLEAPVKHLLPWEEAVLKFLQETNEKLARSLKKPLKLDIAGSFGRNHVTPRGINSTKLLNLVCVEGIVTKAVPHIPKLLRSVHVRRNTPEDGHVEVREHRDQTDLGSRSEPGGMPTADAEGNELMMELGRCVYKDISRFTLSEAPEATPPGQVPRSCEVLCEGDLAEKTKPGERVQVVGVYRSFPRLQQDYTTGVWPARLIATNITPIHKMTETPFTTDDIRNIKEIAARPDAFELLARSFAPSICGHEKVKAGMLLQLIGGTEKNLSNGTRLRGVINVLLVGDPSCGKSQMLRFVMNTAPPPVISTTGRGSSGVGLTAAMTREPSGRDFILEAGAMVLADRGVICIDEFDKMNQVDRVAIHEAMEQGCVTIAKAGMHVELNARCSVLAAANPKYGMFDDKQDLAKNINLPDSLLSRFDLVFIVRDKTTESIDRRIATQVLRQAMQRLGSDGLRRGVEQVHSTILERHQDMDRRNAQETSEVFEKFAVAGDGDAPPEVLTIDFLRKYLKFSRRLRPKMSERAQEVISEKYVDMRMRFQSGFLEQNNPESNRKPRLAVTTRTLEALIRLSTAHAKLKLRKEEVLEEDVVEAYKLMLAAREEDLPKSATQVAAGDDDGDIDGNPMAEDGPAKKKARTDHDDSRPGPTEISSVRLSAFTTLVARTFAKRTILEIPQGDLLESINAEQAQGEPSFGLEEFGAGLEQLEKQNKVAVIGDMVVALS